MLSTLALGVALGLLAGGGIAWWIIRALRERSHAYLRGVHSLLSEDPDAAIEALTRAARLSPDTLETYFALAALYRRKGDFERAIRIHQNIGLMPGIAAASKLDALEGLADDFRAAGLHGRAVETYERLLAAQQEAGAPASQLAWVAAGAALSAARGMQGERARELADAALRLDGDCPAAHLALGSALALQGDRPGALAAWTRGLHGAPRALELVLPDLRAALSADELERFLAGEDLRREYTATVAALSAPARSFTCQACGKPVPGYVLRCPACRAWGRVA